MRRQQHRAASAIDVTTFTAVSHSRRQLADTRRGIADARAAIFIELEEADSQLPSIRTTRANSSTTPTRPKIEVSTLPTYLSKLETRLEAVGKTLNDEIELLVGSVQVRDSETAKAQAERGTMLTLLAVIYLPLQLVTGIFGMNTLEINGGRPGWRACVGALAVAGGVTMGMFVGVRWWGKRRSEMQWEREYGREKSV